MATGTTARQTREGLLLNAGQFLKGDECAEYQSEIPRVEWFSKQREALGIESYIYTFMRIAGCETIQQWGFDETKIDGHDTFNQWAMLIDPSPSGRRNPLALALFVTLNQTLTHICLYLTHKHNIGKESEAVHKRGGACIVTLECAAILPCSEAENVVGHIELVWQRGKEAIDALREVLGPEYQDVLCPLRNGGVSLHKLYGIMHDTCNCANLVAKLMLEVRDRKCREHYGEDAWSKAEPKVDALPLSYTLNLNIILTPLPLTTGESVF